MSAPKSFLRHFVACNRHDPSRFVPFLIEGQIYGFITRELETLLPKHFSFLASSNDGLKLSDTLTSFDARSAALADVTEWICAHFTKKRRGEMYPVVRAWGGVPAAQIDRIAVPWFGIKAWGVHVNGFVRKHDGLHLWIGERAADRLIDPGKLDNMIGGGQPIGLTLEENLCKEAHEEAGIDEELALTSKQVQIISYRQDRNDGLRRDSLFIFDLELPEDFVPQNTDGEVAAFRLMALPELAQIIAETDIFKFNCSLVVIDFMIRHGFIAPEHPEYRELARWLAEPST